MAALTALRENDPSIKSLVVSQFTSFLDVLQRPLRRDGFHFTRLDGTMNQGEAALLLNSRRSLISLHLTLFKVLSSQPSFQKWHFRLKIQQISRKSLYDDFPSKMKI